jgi:hypothetical protein
MYIEQPERRRRVDLFCGATLFLLGAILIATGYMLQ